MNTKSNDDLAIFRRLLQLMPIAWLGVLLLAVTLAGCDSSGGALTSDNTGDSSESYALLTADLGLSAADATSIASRVDGFTTASVDAPEPGFLWELAAEIHASLSDEQLEQLLDRIEATDIGFFGRTGGLRQGAGPGGGQMGGQFARQRPGMRPGGGPGAGAFGAQRPGAMRALAALDLTDEQKESIREIHEAHRDEVRALLQERGTMDADAFREQMDALRESIRAEVEGVLTSEQIEQLEQFRQEAEERRTERQAARESRREEARAVMADVLGLTDAQVAELEALRLDREAMRAEVQELIEAGADREDVRVFLTAERAERKEAVMAIVDDRQYEIMQIHAFLGHRFAVRRAGSPNGGGPNGPGARGMGPGQGVGPGQGFGSGQGPGRIG